MIAVITGDIINSQSANTNLWMTRLKTLLQSWGESPYHWEIYRGDEFQIKCNINEVFFRALAIKSLMKTQEHLDVRLAIGIGNENFTSEKITESNGSAYINSGRLLDELKSNGNHLAIKTLNDAADRDLNIVLKWAAKEFDRWTVPTSEIVFEMLTATEKTQESLAAKYSISQSSVSQRLKRASYDLIMETDQYFRKKISQL